MPKYFWLNLLMEDHHLGYITKLQKKTNRALDTWLTDQTQKSTLRTRNITKVVHQLTMKEAQIYSQARVINLTLVTASNKAIYCHLLASLIVQHLVDWPTQANSAQLV
jgi:hypothetical protein